MKKTTINKKNITTNTNDSYNHCKNRIQDSFKKININPTFIEIKEIDLNNILCNKNKVRFYGEDKDTIDELVKMIKNNEYKPYDHIPPIVDVNDDGTYTLLSGHHRRHAHNNLKLKTMVCAVFDFAGNERNRAVFRSAENCAAFEPFVKNVTKIEDHVDDVANRINEGTVAKTAADIKSYLLQTGMVSKHAGSQHINNYLNKINFALGNLKDYIHSWQPKETKQIVSEIESSTTNTKCFPVTFKVLGKDIDFDYRIMKKIFDSLFENPNRNIRIVASVNNANETKLQEIRKYKQAKLVSEHVEHCKKVVAIVESGIDLSKITLDFLPQIGSEINKDKDFGKSRYIENIIEDCNSKVDTQENDDYEIVVKVRELTKNCDTKTKNKLKKMLAK